MKRSSESGQTLRVGRRDLEGDGDGVGVEAEELRREAAARRRRRLLGARVLGCGTRSFGCRLRGERGLWMSRERGAKGALDVERQGERGCGWQGKGALKVPGRCRGRGSQDRARASAARRPQSAA